MSSNLERFFAVATKKGLLEAHREVPLTDDEIDRVVELAAEVLGFPLRGGEGKLKRELQRLRRTTERTNELLGRLVAEGTGHAA